MNEASFSSNQRDSSTILEDTNLYKHKAYIPNSKPLYQSPKNDNSPFATAPELYMVQYEGDSYYSYTKPSQRSEINHNDYLSSISTSNSSSSPELPPKPPKNKLDPPILTTDSEIYPKYNIYNDSHDSPRPSTPTASALLNRLKAYKKLHGNRTKVPDFNAKTQNLAAKQNNRVFTSDLKDSEHGTDNQNVLYRLNNEPFHYLKSKRSVYNPNDNIASSTPYRELKSQQSALQLNDRKSYFNQDADLDLQRRSLCENSFYPEASAIAVPLYQIPLNAPSGSRFKPHPEFTQDATYFGIENLVEPIIRPSASRLFGKTKSRPKPLNIANEDKPNSINTNYPQVQAQTQNQINANSYYHTAPENKPTDVEFQAYVTVQTPTLKKEKIKRFGLFTLSPHYLRTITCCLSPDFIALLGLSVDFDITRLKVISKAKMLDNYSDKIYNSLSKLDSNALDFIFGKGKSEWPLNSTSLSTEIILGSQLHLQQKRAGRSGTDYTPESYREVLYSKCKGLSLWAFILNLTDKTGRPSTLMINKLLSSFRFFNHPVDLLRLLVIRYINCDIESGVLNTNNNNNDTILYTSNSSGDYQKTLEIVQLRTINIIKHWLKYYKEDFQEFYHLKLLLLEFLNHIKSHPTKYKFAIGMEFRLLNESLFKLETTDISKNLDNNESIKPEKRESAEITLFPSSPKACNFKDKPEFDAGMLTTGQSFIPQTAVSESKSKSPAHTLKSSASSSKLRPQYKIEDSTVEAQIREAIIKSKASKTSLFSYFKNKEKSIDDKDTLSYSESQARDGETVNAGNIPSYFSSTVEGDGFSHQATPSTLIEKHPITIDTQLNNTIPFPKTLPSTKRNSKAYQILGEVPKTGNEEIYCTDSYLNLKKAYYYETQNEVSIDNTKYKSIVSLDPGLLAETLTLIEYNYYKNITSTEISKRISPLVNTSSFLKAVIAAGSFNNADLQKLQTQVDLQSSLPPLESKTPGLHYQNKKDTPNISALANWSNCTTHWAVYSVLSEKTPTRRANMIAHVTHIAYYCLALRNYNGAFGLIGGLTCSSISRLKSTWNLVPNQFKAIIKQIQEIWTARPNHKLYRESFLASLMGNLGPDYNLIFDPQPDFIYLDQINSKKPSSAKEPKKNKARNGSISGVKSFLKIMSAKDQNSCHVYSQKSDKSPTSAQALFSADKTSNSLKRSNHYTQITPSTPGQKQLAIPGSDTTLYEGELIREIGLSPSHASKSTHPLLGASNLTADQQENPAQLKRAFSLVDVGLINRARLIRNKTVNGRLRSSTHKIQESTKKKDKAKAYSMQNSKSSTSNVFQFFDQRNHENLKSLIHTTTEQPISPPNGPNSGNFADLLSHSADAHKEAQAQDAQQTSALSLKSPVIPFFGLHLKDLLYADEANNSYIENSDLGDNFANVLNFKNAHAILPSPKKLQVKSSYQGLRSESKASSQSEQFPGLKSFSSTMNLKASVFLQPSNQVIMSMTKFRIISSILSEIRDSQELSYNINASSASISWLKNSILNVKNDIIELCNENNIEADKKIMNDIYSSSMNVAEKHSPMEFGYLSDSFVNSPVSEGSKKSSASSIVMQRLSNDKFRNGQTFRISDASSFGSESRYSAQSGEQKLDQAFFKALKYSQDQGQGQGQGQELEQSQPQAVKPDHGEFRSTPSSRVDGLEPAKPSAYKRSSADMNQLNQKRESQFARNTRKQSVIINIDTDLETILYNISKVIE